MSNQTTKKLYAVIVRAPLFRHYAMTVEAGTDLDAVLKTGPIVRRFNLDDDGWECMHELDFYGEVEPVFVVQRQPGDPQGHRHDD